MSAPRWVMDTTPYPWPFDGGYDPARLALVVTGSGGDHAGTVPVDESVEANIDQLRDVVGAAGGLVVLVEHLAPHRRRAAIEAPAGPASALAARDGEVVAVAAGLDGFYGSRLDRLLNGAGRDLVILAGRGLETTVHSTMRRANDRGYECLLAVDACAAIDPACRGAARSMIEMSGGIFGAVGTTAAVIELVTTSPSTVGTAATAEEDSA